VLAILIWAIPLLNLSGLCGSITTATDKEKKAAKVYMTAALINLGSNLIAVPLWGYIGAAVSTVITEAISLFLFYRVLHSEFPLTDLKNVLLKPVLAGGVMAGVIWLVLDWPLGLVIISGAVVYPLALLALKPFNQTELEVIKGITSSLRRRFKLEEA
jgi:O-antigen/teichoic acid export membrane protein